MVCRLLDGQHHSRLLGLLRMSVEKYARRALWRMTFFRLCGEMFVLPQVFLRMIQSACGFLGSWFKNLEMLFFTLELDAARRYKLLTGIDLPAAAHDPGRYALLDAQRNEDAQTSFMQQLGADIDE